MSWSCKRCTFLNSPPPKPSPTCRICFFPKSPPSPKPSEDSPKWSCKACTFLNRYNKSSCDICGTRVSLPSASFLENLDWDESIGSVFLPLRSAIKRKESNSLDYLDSRGFPSYLHRLPPSMTTYSLPGTKRLAMEETSSENPTPGGASLTQFKIMSYNVWFREDLEVEKRMEAIGNLIFFHSPDIICLQEVTPNIFNILRKSSWWNLYCPSISPEFASLRSYFCMQLCKHPVKSFNTKPFRNSGMGRELSVAEIDVGSKGLIVATTHLESPCPGPPKWDQMFSKERVEQAREAIGCLSSNPNVIFCGDMNWDEKLDGEFPLMEGWEDAWEALKGSDVGWTYDTKSNAMLCGNRALQKRLDRFLCSLRDFRVLEVEMIGKEAIPGLVYMKEKKVKNGVKALELPVLPSDHFGLVLTIEAID